MLSLVTKNYDLNPWNQSKSKSSILTVSFEQTVFFVSGTTVQDIFHKQLSHVFKPWLRMKQILANSRIIFT